MRGIAFVAALAACLPGICSQVRSSSSGRHMSFSGASDQDSYTAADYVQDGLAMMYDGEWNAGVGTHDGNALTWTDISGNGRDLTQGWGDVTWEDKCLVSCTGVLYSLDVGFPANDGKSDRTIEIVSGGTNIGSQRCHLTIHPRNSAKTWGLGHYRWGDSLTIRTGYSFSSGNGGITVPDIADAHKNMVACKTVILEGGQCTLVVDGARSGPFDRMNYTSMALGIGNTIMPLAEATETARIYVVRIYDRILSDEEILRNYMIDKARFGL